MITSRMISSGTSSAPPSTMRIASLVPATTILRSVSSNCALVGFTTNSPLIRPIRTPAIGPFQGTSEIDNAAEAPIIPQMAGSQSWSTDITVATTCTSLRTPLSNNGRIGRSIKRLFKIADSGGRASRLMNPPGKRPTAYIFSS